MSVLWVMPNWNVPSELWMQRMLRMVSGDLAGICANQPLAGVWDDGAPAFALDRRYRSVFERALRLATFQRLTPGVVLNEAITTTRPRKVLVHYLDFACRFEKILQGCGADVLVHCHGYDVSWDIRREDDAERPYFNGGYLPAVRRLATFATFIANSQHTRRQLIDVGVPVERIVVKHPGVPVPSTPPRRSSRGRLRVLFLGRLIDVKGPDLVIRAFDLACSRGLDAELVFAGDGSLRESCEAMARSSPFGDRIQFLGFVDEATGRRLREESDIFTAHNQTGPRSRQVEALGVSVLEAMAEGLPVVSGRSGGLVETVVHGETGFLVNPGDVEAHARALLDLSKDETLRTSMGMAGWRRARDLFSLEGERDSLRAILGLTGRQGALSLQ